MMHQSSDTQEHSKQDSAETTEKNNLHISHFPRNIGLLTTAILHFFIGRTQINQSQISVLKKLREKSIIVFANKYKSNFDFLFFHSRYKQLDLPFPEIGFYYRILSWQPISRLIRVLIGTLRHFFKTFRLPNPYTDGYYRQALLNGRAGFVSLIDKKGFYRRFVKAKTDPIRYLIELQNTQEKPVFIIPQIIFYSKDPQRSEPTLMDILFGSKERPGKLKRLFTLLRSPKKVFFEICDPVNIQEFLQQEKVRPLPTAHQAFALRRELIRRINRHRQSIIGPVIKSRVELKESILTNERLQRYIAEQAEETDSPIQQVQKKADDYVEEIAANYSQNWIRMYDITLKVIFKLLFEGMILDEEGLEKVRRMSTRGPLVVVPCHKSHLDYLIISWLFHHNHLPCPHIAAGKNLSFWPLGTIFRGGGAFFLRRTFKGKPLYAKVFSEYIYKILEEGFNLEFFIEGGRSRTGKLLMPKLGLMSIILDAFRKKACEDLIIVPVYIGYDRVLEEKAYIHEIEGGQKEPESLKQVIQARKTLKTRYGKVYVNFSNPVSLKQYLAESRLQIENLQKQEMVDLCNTLGLRILNAINRESVVTPHGVMAGALLNISKKRFAKSLLMECLDTYMAYLRSTGANLADTLRNDPASAFDQVLEAFENRKFIERASRLQVDESVDTGELLKILENKRPSLDYYKNNCVIFFVPAAFTATAILVQDTFQFSTDNLTRDYLFLQELFSGEFAYDASRSAEQKIRKTLKAFIDGNMLIPHPTLPDTYRLTASGFRKLKFFARFLKTFLESYMIVLTFLIRYPKQAVDSSDRLKKIQSMGNRMYKRKEMDRIEALSKVTFKNAVQYFDSLEPPNGNAQDEIEAHFKQINKYINILDD